MNNLLRIMQSLREGRVQPFFLTFISINFIKIYLFFLIYSIRLFKILLSDRFYNHFKRPFKIFIFARINLLFLAPRYSVSPTEKNNLFRGKRRKKLCYILLCLGGNHNLYLLWCSNVIKNIECELMQ